MSKAILIIDMPNACHDCPLFNDFYANMNCRAANRRSINYPYPVDFRQDWCPLTPVPEKMEEIIINVLSEKGIVRGG